MKTAISLPDDMLIAADDLAGRLGVSRSELYAMAVAEFLAKHHAGDITAVLDELYASEASTVDPALRRAQRRSLGLGGSDRYVGAARENSGDSGNSV